MTNPHAPYFHAVLAALGALADPAASFNEFCSDDGEVMLTDIYIQIEDTSGRYGLVWNQNEGWLWGPLKADGFLGLYWRLVDHLVATPDSLNEAVRTRLGQGGPSCLTLPGDDTEPIDRPLSDALAKAVTEGNLDHDTATRLASYL